MRLLSAPGRKIKRGAEIRGEQENEKYFGPDFCGRPWRDGARIICYADHWNDHPADRIVCGRRFWEYAVYGRKDGGG